MINFVFHFERYNDKNRELMFFANFNVKKEITIIKKSRKRVFKKLKKDVFNFEKTIKIYYTFIIKSNEIIVFLWKNESKLHFEDFSTKNIKIQLLRSTLTTLNSTKWQFETTTRSINKFKTNVKIKINKNDESNEKHKSEKNDEKSNEKFSNDHDESNEKHENEKNDEQSSEKFFNDQSNDEKTNIVNVIDITANFANDEKTNIVDVIDISANFAIDEKTNIVDVIDIATNFANVIDVTANLANEIQRNTVNVIDIKISTNIIEIESNFIDMINFEDDMIIETNFENFDNMKIDSKNQQRSMRFENLMKNWKIDSIVFSMNKMKKTSSTARSSLSSMRKTSSTARSSLSSISLKKSTFDVDKSKKKTIIQFLSSSTSLLAKLKSVSSNSVHKKTRTLMWKINELISFLFSKIRFTQEINHLQSFFEVYDDLTKKLNNDNENNLWYLTSIFIIDIFIS